MLKIINGKNVSDGDTAWAFAGDSYVRTSDRRKWPRVNGIAVETDPSLVFDMNIGLFGTLDRKSGIAFSQTYAYNNIRYRTNAAGLLEAVPQHTIVIDHIGASLTPALRLEPAGTNLLFNSNTFTAAAGWMLTNVTGPATPDAIGPDGTLSAWTMTDAGAGTLGFIAKTIPKSASDSTTYFHQSLFIPKTTGATTFPGFGLAFLEVATRIAQYALNTNTGAVTLRAGVTVAANIGIVVKSAGNSWEVFVCGQDNGANTSVQFTFMPAVNADASATWDATTQGSCVVANGKLTTGNIPSSYFAGAAAIGSELVTNGDFAAVTEGEAAAGVTVVGNCYKILERTDIDYTADGAPNNNVGTYFNSTVGGAIIDGSGGNDRLNNVIATNWTAETGWAPQATAGVLTGKIQKIAGTASTLSQNPLTAGKVYRLICTITRTAGYLSPSAGGSLFGTYGSNITTAAYAIANATYLSFIADAAFAGTIDDVSVMEHGTVRASEANTVTIATDPDLATALTGSFTIAMKIRFPHAKAAVSAASTILTFVNTVNTGIYQDSSGVFTVSDGTNTATNDDAFIADTDYILVWRADAVAGEMAVGLGLPGAVSFDAVGTYDGAVPTTGDVTYLMKAIGQGGAYIQWIKAYDKLLTDAQINAM